MALASASSLAWYSSSVFGANGLGGLNKFSRFHVPIRMTMTHNPSAQALIDLAVHPRRGYRIAVRRKITRHSPTGCRRVRERLRDARRSHARGNGFVGVGGRGGGRVGGEAERKVRFAESAAAVRYRRARHGPA